MTVTHLGKNTDNFSLTINEIPGLSLTKLISRLSVTSQVGQWEPRVTCVGDVVLVTVLF